MTLFFTTLCLSLIVQNSVNAFGMPSIGGATEPPNFDEIVSLCQKCTCAPSTMPLHVDCAELHLTDLKEDIDWSIKNGSDINTRKMEITFQGNIMTEIPAFTTYLPISALSFEGNEIHEIADYAFGALDDLEFLDLSYNKLHCESLSEATFERNATSGEFQPLPLTHLMLSSNDIRSIHKDAFDHITNVEVLYLDHNPLGDISEHTAHALAALRNLKVLDLSFTGLKTLPVDFSSVLSSVTELNLSGNEFETIPDSLWFTQTLNSLTLDQNPLRFIRDNTFSSLLHVRNLSMNHMQELVEISGGSFKNMVDLKKIQLKHNLKLNFISKDAFRAKDSNESAYRLNELKEISLHGSALTTLHQTMLPWHLMDVIDIQNNLWDCDCKIHWIFDELITIIEVKDPELNEGLLCYTPLELRDRSFDELVRSKDEPPACTSSDETTTNDSQQNIFNSVDKARIPTVWIVVLIAVLTSFVVSVLVLISSRRIPCFKGDPLKPTVYYRRQLNEPDEIMS